jgi:hypothetical protein
MDQAWEDLSPSPCFHFRDTGSRAGKGPAALSRGRKSVPKLREIDAPSPKADSFRFEEEALFHGKFAGERNTPARTENTLPRKIASAFQHSGNVAGTAGKSGSSRYSAIGGDLAARNRTDRGRDGARQWRNSGRLSGLHTR